MGSSSFANFAHIGKLEAGGGRRRRRVLTYRHARKIYATPQDICLGFAIHRAPEHYNMALPTFLTTASRVSCDCRMVSSEHGAAFLYAESSVSSRQPHPLQAS
eukprot:jgi/Ulvmu1/4265/UM194_0005.1